MLQSRCSPAPTDHRLAGNRVGSSDRQHPRPFLYGWTHSLPCYWHLLGRAPWTQSGRLPQYGRRHTVAPP